MAAPKIGYQNLLESASSITVTDAASGFEKALAYNWRTFDGWKASSTGTVYYTVDLGSAQSVDYWACVSHTLGTNSGSIKLQYSSDNFVSDTNDFAAALSPSNDNVLFQSVASAVSARYWRWEITSTPASFFGVLSLGEALTMSRAVGSGFQLPREARNNTTTNQVSEGGAFLGKTVIRRGFKSNYRLGTLQLSFARGDWSTFIDHAENKPFFFSWNPDFDDTVYAWIDQIRPVRYDRNNTIEVALRMEGIF